MERIECSGIKYFEPWQADDLCTIIEGVNLREGQGPLVVHKSCSNDFYYNFPVAFDIETTSFIDDNKKAATMYAWVLSLCGLPILGRTWEEFDYALNIIYEHFLEYHPNRRILIYVHNLDYDFQFFRKRFTWKKVFSMDYYKPLFAVDVRGFEFRCSYKLTNMKLDNLSRSLNDKNLKKLTGNLDYNLPRHSQTPLSDEEIDYCINDAQIVVEYIARCIEKDGDITRIPLTLTGYVRRECRKQCLASDSYRKTISHLKLTPDVYKMLRKCFQGGFAHANPDYIGALEYDIAHMDITSCYPAVLISEKYPMGSPELVRSLDSWEEFEAYLKHYCCMFNIKIEGLQEVIPWAHPLLRSKCHIPSDVSYSLDHGRVVTADVLFTSMTDVDWEIFKIFYAYRKVYISNLYVFKKQYLPKEFVECILHFYKQKTRLKGNEDEKAEYEYFKSMVNSTYGMTVTDIVRMKYEYLDDEWENKTEEEQAEWKEENIERLINKYNVDSKRFLYYPWGVWCTAYARKNLLLTIANLGNDYVYSDTDAVFFKNYEKHKQFFVDYHNMIDFKMKKALEFQGLPLDSYKHKTDDGEICPLGFWTFKGIYPKFKTLGVKRYIEELDEKTKKKTGQTHQMTCAGVSKTKGLEYLTGSHTYKILKFSLTPAKVEYNFLTCKPKLDPFEEFNHSTVFPPEKSGNLIYSYGDFDIEGNITDYFNITAHYHEKSFVHLQPTEYDLDTETQKYHDCCMNFLRKEDESG